MAEIVHLREGDAVTLRPCPAWCTEDRHFAGGTLIDADDGYHHLGTEIEVPTACPFGRADGRGPSDGAGGPEVLDAPAGR